MMKLALVVLTDQIPGLAGKAFNSANWDLTFEAGLVTMTVKDGTRGEETYLVPLARVIAMRPEKAAPKK